jgi:hypothetical protein
MREGRAEGGAGYSPRRSSNMGGSWGRGRSLTVHGAHVMGVVVAGEGTSLMGRAHEPTRSGAHESATALTGRSHRAERERRRASERDAASWAGLGRKAEEGGRLGSFPISFIPEFLILFPFIFSFESKLKHAPNSNSNNSNMCIKQKYNLGSA